jgi:transposase
LITNDFDSSKEEIIQKYRGLIKIEETFRVIKSDLEGRPVYVRTEQHIKAHFLTCFLALIFIRLIQKRMNGKYSAEAIQDALRSANCIHIQGKIYSFTKQTEIFKELCSKINLNLDFEFQKEEIIRNIFKEFLKEEFILPTS